MSDRPSRLRQFLVMLPFFLVGVGLPVYFYGFSGDGPPNLTPERYSPVTTMAPAPVPAAPSSPGDPYAQSGDQTQPGAGVSSRSYQRPAGIVMFMRGIFEGFVDRYVSTNVSPASIMLVAFLGLFGLMFVAVRVLLALVTGTIGGVLSFLIHKAAAPMFMGFLAVGSTWGIHQTVAQEFGMTWAATTVTLTAAVASLFALAGVKIR